MSNHNFKIGDRVRVIRYIYNFAEMGEELEIQGIYADAIRVMRIDNPARSSLCPANFVEKIEFNMPMPIFPNSPGVTKPLIPSITPYKFNFDQFRNVLDKADSMGRDWTDKLLYGEWNVVKAVVDLKVLQSITVHHKDIRLFNQICTYGGFKDYLKQSSSIHIPVHAFQYVPRWKVTFHFSDGEIRVYDLINPKRK